MKDERLRNINANVNDDDNKMHEVRFKMKDES